MRIIAVDDENLVLSMLEKELHAALPSAEVAVFADPDDAMDYVRTNDIDIAFLDIQLGTMSGIELAKEIKKLQPYVNIVFCTGYAEYMADAFQLRASDYLLKPVTAEKIRHAIDSMRYPPKLHFPENKLYLRCYGRFEAYYNGKQIDNLPKRAKELLAYLVYRRGELCATREIMKAIFADLTDSYFRVARMDLEAVLRPLGQMDVLVKQWGKLALDPKKVVCDWYEYTSGNPEAINLYQPQFMEQYAWAQAEAPRK